MNESGNDFITNIYDYGIFFDIVILIYPILPILH
jgi:hypothetical protein